MNANLGREQEFTALQQNWEAVGRYLSVAMQEVALELGDEELASEVALAGTSDSILPNLDALRMLEGLSPGSAELVMTRTAELQQDAHQRELDEIGKTKPKKIWQAILDGSASLNIFGNPPRKR